jgi:hypothetical protein
MTHPAQQVPAIHHRRVGDIIVTSVSDGFLDGSMAVIQNIAPEDATRILREAHRPLDLQARPARIPRAGPRQTVTADSAWLRGARRGPQMGGWRRQTRRNAL